MHASRHLNWVLPRGGTLLGFLFHCSFAAAGTVFQTDFEAAEGHVAGTTLIGQSGWHGLSPISAEAAGVAVDPQNQPALGQFGYIGGYRIPILADESTETKQIVTRNIAYTPGTDGGNVVTISVDLVPYYDSPDAFDHFGVAIVNSYQQPLCTVALTTLGSLGSQLLVIDQLDEAGASLPGIIYVSGNRYELRFELDFGNNTWSAWFGGQAAATNRTLSTAGMALDLGSIAFTWGRYILGLDSSANHYLIFDKLLVSAEPPPRLDASVSLTAVPGSLDMDLSIVASPGSAIILQYSPLLDGSWEDLVSFTVPVNGIVGYRHVGVRSLPSGFYRVAGTPDG